MMEALCPHAPGYGGYVVGMGSGLHAALCKISTLQWSLGPGALFNLSDLGLCLKDFSHSSRALGSFIPWSL